MPTDLHYICQHQLNWRKLDQLNHFETGNWVASVATADEAIRGRIYLHETQRGEAWHGGTIISWRPSD